MRYMGGKFRQSKEIARIIGRDNGTGFRYFEPFCGGMWSACRVIQELQPVEVVLSDISEPLICMWRGLINGEVELPRYVTDMEYAEYKRNKDPKNPMTAWFGHGVSFGGKWFGGMARQDKTKGRQEVYDFSPQVSSTMKQVEILKKGNPTLRLSSYEDLVFLPKGWVIYCDPPYEDSTKAHNYTGTFDHEKFWEDMRIISKDNSVYISCFKCPGDFEVLHDWGDTIVRHNNGNSEMKGKITEKLVKFKEGIQ